MLRIEFFATPYPWHEPPWDHVDHDTFPTDRKKGFEP
jgi:hypothetical protein